MSRSSIEEQLRKAVEKAGVYAVSRDTGINNAMLYRFVNGNRGISLATAATLCKHLRLRLTNA